MEARASYNQLSTASIRPTSVVLKADDDDANKSPCCQQDANTDSNYLCSPVVQRISTGEEKDRPPAESDKVTRLTVKAGDTTTTSSGVVRRNRAAASQNRARLVQSLYISSSEPSVSFQSALSRFQKLASCQSSADGISSTANESVGNFGCSDSEPGDSHVKNGNASAESVSQAVSSRQSEELPISTGNSVDCKTIQTDESFLQLYRSKRKLQARRSEAVSNKEKRLGQSRRPEAALELKSFSDRPSLSRPLGGYSTSSKDGPRRSAMPEAVQRTAGSLLTSVDRLSLPMEYSSPEAKDTFSHSMRPEAVLKTAGSLLTSVDRLSLPKEYSPPEAKETFSHSVRPEAVLRNVVSSPVFIKERLNLGWEASPGVPPVKPVRGQCWDLANLSSSLQPPSSMSPQGVARPPVVTSAPYKRSLSRSSQCLLSSSLSVQSLCSPPALPWDHQRSRDHLAHQDWEAKFFSDCVYEGQSTLV